MSVCRAQGEEGLTLVRPESYAPRMARTCARSSGRRASSAPRLSEESARSRWMRGMCCASARSTRLRLLCAVSVSGVL